jgi:hypothetical protein
MEPMGVRLHWGLPFVGEMGLALSDGILAFQLCMPHLLNVNTQRLSRGFPTHCAVLHPTLYYCTFLLPPEELIQLLSAGPNVPNLCDAEREFHHVSLV